MGASGRRSLSADGNREGAPEYPFQPEAIFVVAHDERRSPDLEYQGSAMRCSAEDALDTV